MAEILANMENVTPPVIVNPPTVSTYERLAVLQGYYAKFSHATGLLQSAFLLAVRVYWGFMLFGAGLMKFQNFDRTVGFFGSLGIPVPVVNAILAAGTEMIGGLFLVLGLASRLTAIPVIFTMLVAYFTAHRDKLMAIFSEPAEFYGAPEFTFLFAALIVLVFGPGKASLDYILGWICRPTPKPQH